MKPRILIVDDSNRWVMHHSAVVHQIFDGNIETDIANSAKEGVEKLTSSIDCPYNFILTDMQMEPDFLPLFAGEWFIKQIKNFNEYKKTKIIAISAAENLKQIAKNYGVSYIPKYKCNDINAYCNELLKKE